MPGAGNASGVSLLVRFWLEPRESAGAEPVLRGYVRNLKTGEESYLNDPSSLAEQVRRQLEADERALGAERPKTGEAAG